MSNSFLTITDNGTISMTQETLKTIGDKRLGAWVRWAIGEQSDEFVDFVKSNYLSGQSLKIITGETRDHVGAWLQRKTKGKKSNTFLIRPGVRIHGLQNYIEKWTGTKHEFMKPAFMQFGSDARITRYVDMNLTKMFDKVQKEMDQK